MAATTTSSLISSNSNSVIRHHHGSCSKIDCVAMWVINGVASAFFASLERCSCIGLPTVDDANDDDAPLIPNNGNVTLAPCESGRRRTAGSRGKGKKSGVLYANFN
ncbi:hypothetical protein LINPERPRIM_LOCUS15442 [Linum perenne]